MAVSFLWAGFEPRTRREVRIQCTVAVWQRVGSWWDPKMRSGDKNWGRGTEDKLRLLIKTPDFGTMIPRQFWAVYRKPKIFYTPCHLGLLLLFVTLEVYLWGGREFEDSGNNSKYFIRKVPSNKGSSSILVVQKWANGDRNMTLLSRIPRGKIHFFLSHTLLSTYHRLSWFRIFVCVSVSLTTSEFLAGRKGVISIFLSPGGLTEANKHPWIRVVTEHSRCHRGLPPWTWPHKGQTTWKWQNPCLTTRATASAPSDLKRSFTSVHQDS